MIKSLLTTLTFLMAALSPSGETPANCSTFLLKTESEILLGHNLDESPELHVPGRVCINPRGIGREGMTWNELIADPGNYDKALIPFEEKPEPKIRWESEYGSITFNSEGLDFPDGGINEKGLAVFEMSLGLTRYTTDPSLPTLFMPLWIQYLLDTCSTLAEAVESARAVNLQGWTWHYFVSDRDGNCAIFEFLDGKPVIRENVAFPILCNTEYAAELERLKMYQGFGGVRPVRNRPPRAPRFVRAAKRLKDYAPSNRTPPREYALKVLDEIQIPGWNKWAILIDVPGGRIEFHTNRNRKLRRLSMSDFDFSAGSPSRMLDIHVDLEGEVAARFLEYSRARNLELTGERAEHLFKERFKGLADNGLTAEIYARRFADYSERIRNREGDRDGDGAP